MAGNRARTLKILGGLMLFFLLSFILTQIFLRPTSVGSPKFGAATVLVAVFSALNFLMIMVLAFVLGRNLIKLYFERRAQKPGARFKTRLVVSLIALSLTPTLLLFLFSYYLSYRSIRRWFSAPVEQLLYYSRTLADDYYRQLTSRYGSATLVVADRIGGDGLLDPSRAEALGALVEQVSRDFSLPVLRVYDGAGQLRYARGPASKLSPDLREGLQQSLRGQPFQKVVPGHKEDVIWCSAPIRDAGQRTLGAVLTETLIPGGASFKAYSVHEAYEKYLLLQKEVRSIQRNYFLVLGLATLVLLFSFAWFGLYVAKKITVPIQSLVDASREVAAGKLDHRVSCVAHDELALLVESFNKMTRTLEENQGQIAATHADLQRINLELEERRRYIETVLQNIATGVISLDREERVATVNPAALSMLQLKERESVGKHIRETFDPALYQAIQSMIRRSRTLGTTSREISIPAGEGQKHIAATLTPLRDSAGGRMGYVLVLDDLTELIRAEKAAAWQEVARRMAHEIKNPLTPIQLSAERLVKNFDRHFAAERVREPVRLYSAILQECSSTIVQEATSLKRLVDEFSTFARLPAAQLVEYDIHKVLQMALNLYNGRASDPQIQQDLASHLPLLKIDPEQMKRVFINLIDNALEAMADTPGEKRLSFRTALAPSGEKVTIEVRDTGCGIVREARDSLFLPYFSTKKQGTGLGLAIVRHIISDHMGRIYVEDNHPRGAAFIIELPVSQQLT